MSRFDHTARPFVPYTLSNFDWSTDPAAEGIFTQSLDQARTQLDDASLLDLYKYFKFAIKYRCEDRIFLIFEILLGKEEIPVDQLGTYMDAYPSLAYCVLKKFLPELSGELPDDLASIGLCVVRNVIRSANHFGIAALAALERLAHEITKLDFQSYCETLWWTVHTVRAPQLFQEVLMTLHDSRATVFSQDNLSGYAHIKALGVVFDRAEEAADTCPCDDAGRPKRQRTPPIHATLRPSKTSPDDDPNPELSFKTLVTACIRVDAQTNVRLHSHVRLKVASPAESSVLPATIVDAIVIRASRGELLLDVNYPLPPEWDTIDWLLYDAGSTATSRAMINAVQTLAEDEEDCCKFSGIITGTRNGSDMDENADESAIGAADHELPTTLNDSQCAAVRSARPGRLALIWGPPGEYSNISITVTTISNVPGTGKTTVVVDILLKILQENSKAKILMAASTHNGE